MLTKTRNVLPFWASIQNSNLLYSEVDLLKCSLIWATFTLQRKGWKSRKTYFSTDSSKQSYSLAFLASHFIWLCLSDNISDFSLWIPACCGEYLLTQYESVRPISSLTGGAWIFWQWGRWWCAGSRATS